MVAEEASIPETEVLEYSSAEEDDGILSVLPVPEEGECQVKRPRGRPRKWDTAALAIKKKSDFIASDPLTLDIEKGTSSVTVLQRIRLEVSKEIAAIQYQRIELDREGKDTTNVSLKRINALERLAKIELKVKLLEHDSINLSSEKMQKLFMLWVETMREVASEVLPPEAVDLFLNRFATAMDGWEKKAEEALR